MRAWQPRDCGAWIGAARVNLYFHGGGVIAVNRLGLNHACLRALTHERLIRGDAVRRKRGQIADRLNDVGFPLTIFPNKRCHTGRQVQDNLTIGPEVRKS